MILIDKVTSGNTVQPARELTAQEAPTVIATWGNATQYIYFQAGDTSSPEWTAYQAEVNAQLTASELAIKQVARYMQVAPELLFNIYKLNTDAGITAATGNQIERDYEEVLRAVERGMFGLALLRLSTLPDSGIVYQGTDLKEQWNTLITTYKTNYQL
ncbi:MAG: hypothetical protein FD123_2546 [Bacteroidetes bacterium]|nr:MAG: hypothetical protein FD123_2546 [Bacteroidota bacterium]